MKTNNMALKYEVTGNKTVSTKKVLLHEVDSLGTPSILWLLVKRHRMQLVSAWAIGITLVWAFPPLPDLVLSMFQ